MADINNPKIIYTDKVDWLNDVKLAMFWKKEKNIVFYIKDVVDQILNNWVWSQENINKLKSVPLNLGDFSLVVRRLVSDLKNAIRSESSRFMIEDNLSKIEFLIDWYLLQLIWKSDLMIRFCKWKDEIFSNSYLKWVWEQNNKDDWHKVEKMYDDKTLYEINKWLDLLIDGWIVWYNKSFITTKWTNTIWSTNRVPNSDYNIRIWVKLKSFEDLWYNKENYINYLKEVRTFYTVIEKSEFNFTNKDFRFLTTANKLLNNFYENKQFINLDDALRKNFELLENYIYMSALTLDYFFKFNPSPARINRGKEFPILSESFVKLTWYTRQELEDYFYEITEEQKQFQNPQIRWEIDTLLYKWEDYKKVLKFVKENETNSKNWQWYKDKVFTLTTKGWIRIDLPWSNIMFTWSDKILTSLRTADLWNLKIHKDED